MKYLCLIENVSDVSVSHASRYGKKKDGTSATSILTF